MVLAVRAQNGLWTAIGEGAVALLVLCFFILGRAGGVPMWLSFPIGQRGPTISDGDPARRARQRRRGSAAED
ncbi:hypothetical protein ACFSBG_09100 [Georgenia yuyongxinii]|uniref:hypothetical protein n=1 Tax=Georgenia yuyongxinii TaxID=2589797 RepID=UPI0036307645